jgi:photosynthetic reaction center cytochrome c subunit
MNRLMMGSALAVTVLLSTACDRPPVEVVNLGFRGLAMEHVEDPRELQDSVDAVMSREPVGLPPLIGGDPAPAGTYQNVQVLGHLSAGEFNRTMLALTQWVSPEEGCNYCHYIDENGQPNYASDQKYTKLVSRRMLQMTQNINVNWTSHVKEDRGVNCMTCHQGQPVPNNYFFFDGPNDPLRNYVDNEGARVQGTVALTSEEPNRQSIKQTEYTYALMMHMSNSLGVNCTYCHNSARFADWSESTPQRVTALRGLRMIREQNMQHMVPLQDIWPEERLGPLGDGPKLACSSCHNGAYKPQYNATYTWGTEWPALTQIGVPHENAMPADAGN